MGEGRTPDSTPNASAFWQPQVMGEGGEEQAVAANVPNPLGKYWVLVILE